MNDGMGSVVHRELQNSPHNLGFANISSTKEARDLVTPQGSNLILVSCVVLPHADLDFGTVVSFEDILIDVFDGL